MTLAGLIRSIRRRGGKRGSFVTIEDMSSQIEVTVSTNALYADALTKDEIVVVDGMVSADSFSGGYRMAAQKIRTLAAARLEFARGVQISLRSCDSDACEALEAAFLPYRKAAPESLSITAITGTGRVGIGTDWNLSP
jgi:DNA polymerase-3 subunit alpha